MLKTWQENEEKADELTKVGLSQLDWQMFKRNADCTSCCRLQTWGIWMRRSWLYILR